MDTKAAGSAPPKFELFPSRQFPQRLAESNLSLAFSDEGAAQLLFDLNRSDVTLHLIDTDVPAEYGDLIKNLLSKVFFHHSPSEITISSSQVLENCAGGTLVGTL